MQMELETYICRPHQEICSWLESHQVFPVAAQRYRERGKELGVGEMGSIQFITILGSTLNWLIYSMVYVCVCSPPARTVPPSGWPQPIDSRAGNPQLSAVLGDEMDPLQWCYRWAYSHIRLPRTMTRCPCPSWVDLHSVEEGSILFINICICCLLI